MRRFTLVVLVLVVAVVAGLYAWQNRPTPLVVSGFIEADLIRVGSRIGGRVAELLVQEGQRVRAGDPLVRIDPFDLREQLARAKAELAAARAAQDRTKSGFRREEIEQAQAQRDRAAVVLEKLVAGPRPREIEIGRQKVKAAQARLELAESEHARLTRLRKEAQAAQTELDKAVRELKSAQAEASSADEELALLLEGTRAEEIAEARAALADADARLKLLQQGYRAEDVAEAAARVQAAEAAVGVIEAQLRELVVAAPCEALVETVDLRPGDLLAPNAPSIALLDPSRLWVRAYVPEARLAEVRLDQRVPVRVDSASVGTLVGRVTYIASEAEFTPRNVQTPDERSKQVFRIKVTLETGRERVRVGMSADVYLDESPP
ncbi:MAG: efflux RND transporter periplasmic adaptor subunit [Phycisphaerae bacterium]|nr:efflux RND transporter periplasmic adaptor subunit [Phycisphaerae bacterium]